MWQYSRVLWNYYYYLYRRQKHIHHLSNYNLLDIIFICILLTWTVVCALLGGEEPGEGGGPAAVQQGCGHAAHPPLPTAPLREPQQAATEPTQASSSRVEKWVILTNQWNIILNLYKNKLNNFYCFYRTDVFCEIFSASFEFNRLLVLFWCVNFLFVVSLWIYLLTSILNILFLFRDQNNKTKYNLVSETLILLGNSTWSNKNTLYPKYLIVHFLKMQTWI